MKGALIDYGTEKIIPTIKNVVFFQFSPELVDREIIIPGKNLKTETDQSATKPIETISFTASFDAGDLLNQGDVVTQMAGIGPQLAALEKFVYPITKESSLVGFVLDKVGDLIPNKKSDSTIPHPREKYPHILFIWGLTRILPVVITSLTITELRYDSLLNPVRAQVKISLNVMQENAAMDKVAKGALSLTNNIKDSAALQSLTAVPNQIRELSKEISDIVGF
jgi:hypothetical protein